MMLAVGAPAQAQTDDPVVLTARKIHTMEPSLPEATAVMVAAGRIVAVGTLESLAGVIELTGAKVDRRFEDKILLPGFVDPHVHPSLPAVLTQFAFLAPEDWNLPTGQFPGVTTPATYRAALTRLVAAYAQDPPDESVPFIAWGWHPLWHGEIYRDELDEMFPNAPVILWHRSFHELIVNTAALDLLGATQEEYGDHHEIDFAKGRFYENGAKKLLPRMPFLMAPDRFSTGMKNFFDMLLLGGVTTAVDMGIGIIGSSDTELELIGDIAAREEPPARIILTPLILDFLARGKNPEQAMAEIDAWRERTSKRVIVDRRFKVMMDGAIFSGLSQMGPPGYLDGHDGLWMVPLEVTEKWARTFWRAGYQIHAHTNGDGSLAALIDMVSRLQRETPRPNHRTVLEHFAYSTEDQAHQLKELGIVVSANPYYHHILSDVYSERWLGPDRGSQMVRLGSLERAGVVYALHSDAPMAPLEPLRLVSTAVNRTTINGNTTGHAERISVERALRAVTRDAAWVVGKEDEIGSIRAGKLADFVVLEEDPMEVAPERLHEIEVWGVVFEGKPAASRP
ncbi:MAG: amidohydrolase [bacterium]|nr:amidohydrolase [bacterium]